MGSAYCQCNCLLRQDPTIIIDGKTDLPIIEDITSNTQTKGLGVHQKTKSTNENKGVSRPSISRRNSSIFTSGIYLDLMNDDLTQMYNSQRKGSFQMKKAYKQLPNQTTHKFNSTIVSMSLFATPPTFQPDKKKRKKDLRPITKINTPFTVKQIKFIRELLIKEALILPSMDETTINSIINIINYIKVQKDVVLYSFDNKLDNIYYMIEKGKLMYIVDNETRFLRKQDGIGTKALLVHSKESCQLKTNERSYLFYLPVDKYKTILKDFGEKEDEEKFQAMKGCNLFNFLEHRLLSKLSSKSTKIKYDMGNEVIKEGTISKSIYIIVEGDISIVKHNSIIDHLFQGDVFGEMSFFNQTSSAYGYFTGSETILVVVPYNLIDYILGERAMNTLLFGIFSAAINKCEYLNKQLTGDRLLPVYESFDIKAVINGAVTNNKMKRIFIPISGSFIKTQTNCISPKQKADAKNKLEIIKKKDVIKGEMYISSILAPKADEVIYSNQCIIFQANWLDLMKKIRCLTQSNVLISELIHLLRNISLFNNLSELKLFLLADSLKIRKFTDNQTILKNGPISNHLFIIKTGQVKVVISNKEMTTLSEGNYFGKMTSSVDNTSRKPVDFIAKNAVECYTLEKEDYEEIVENNSIFTKPYNTLFNSKDNLVTLDSLYYIRDLGYGTYGKVFLVHNDQNLLALKSADIQAMTSQKLLAKYYMNEKKIMLSMNHPFILKLFNTFKTRDYIFFLLEYVNGVTLREYIDQRKWESLRNTNEVYFYGGILFIVLNYLEKKRIIHRDLKPENLMVNNQGYLKVIDFGISKDLSGKDSTTTMFGTPHYMAPEIILGKKYSFAVDYWSVGVILYELFYGKYPFGMDNTDNNNIYKEITEKKVTFPTDPQNKNLNLLLNELLSKSPNKRITSFNQIKEHSFFKSFNFDLINDMTMKPVYLPPTEEIKHYDCDEANKFSWFLKNHLIFSSREGLDVLIKQKGTDYFSEF